MDYSLLLAIEDIGLKNKDKNNINSIKTSFNNESSNNPCLQDRHTYESSCGNYIYHLAIIDYL
jgi:hypothetical protein